jgi:hypothetical protein
MKTSDNPNEGILRIEQGGNNSYRIVFEPVNAAVFDLFMFIICIMIWF